MSKLRLGIAGIGAIAEDYISLIAHGKIDAVLTALNSRNEAHMSSVVQKYALQDVSLFTDYHTMLESGTIDAVILCTPHDLHPDMAVQAIERGIHTLVEKPVGTCRSGAQKICDCLKRHPEICCGVLYCRRMSPVFRHVKDLVSQGILGKRKRANWIITNLYRTNAYHLSSPWRGTWKGEGGGVLMTQASHQLDLFLWLFGMPETVHGFCYSQERPVEVENDALLQMEFDDGATGQFIASSREFPGTNRLELIGDCAQIIVEDDTKLICRILKQPESSFSAASESKFGPIPYTETIKHFEESDNRVQQAEIINDFICAVQTGSKTVCTAEEAMQSLTVINAAYLSAWRGEAVALPMDDALFLQELHKRM